MQNIYDEFKIKNREEKTRAKVQNKKKEFKGIETMQKIFKKNQLVILSLALMLITAGYMNYNNNENEANIQLGELGDAQLVGTNIYVETPNESNADNEQNQVNINEEYKNDVTEDKINEVSTPIENLINNEMTQTNNNVENNNVTVSNPDVSSKDYFVQTRLDSNRRESYKN